MPKLVVLSEGFKDRSCELKAGEKTTVGRLEDNSFFIPEPSVSGHHCEVFIKGADVFVKDLNSTNGTFVDDNRILEGMVKPGQTLRLGQLELRLDNGAPPASAKKSAEPLPTNMKTGVRLNDLEQAAHTTKVDVNPAFKKKSDKVNRLFIGIGVALGVIVVLLLIYAVLGPSGQ
jgi:pSer/pThr/pTyr-binding forkhead associated (FHA) protein